MFPIVLTLFSSWSHFVDFCQECKHHQPKHRKPYAGDEYNQYTHQKRLPIFVKLATTPSGSSLEEAERNKENALPPKNISAHYYKPAPPTGIYQYSHLSSQPSIYYPTTNRSSNVFESPKSIDKTPHFESPIWTPLPSPNC